jgi:hypothetical protein
MSYKRRNRPCVPGCEPARFRRKLISGNRIPRFCRDQLRTSRVFFTLLRTPPEGRFCLRKLLSLRWLQDHKGAPVHFWHSSCITGLAYLERKSQLLLTEMVQPRKDRARAKGWRCFCGFGTQGQRCPGPVEKSGSIQRGWQMSIDEDTPSARQPVGLVNQRFTPGVWPPLSCASCVGWCGILTRAAPAPLFMSTQPFDGAADGDNIAGSRTIHNIYRMIALNK